MDHAQDEYRGEFKDDFSVRVCREWEQALHNQHTPQTRKITLRMAITLGAGGVMIPYFNLLKFGLGGRQGSGRQMYSWIHISDTCRMIAWLYNHKQLDGIFNCSSPHPVTNNVFMKTLRKVTGSSVGLPAAEWMIKMGAVIVGTEPELVLKSRWVIPARIQETGFLFEYPFLEDALHDVISKVPRKQYRLF